MAVKHSEVDRKTLTFPVDIPRRCRGRVWDLLLREGVGRRTNASSGPILLFSGGASRLMDLKSRLNEDGSVSEAPSLFGLGLGFLSSRDMNEVRHRMTDVRKFWFVKRGELKADVCGSESGSIFAALLINSMPAGGPREIRCFGVSRQSQEVLRQVPTAAGVRFSRDQYRFSGHGSHPSPEATVVVPGNSRQEISSILENCRMFRQDSLLVAMIPERVRDRGQTRVLVEPRDISGKWPFLCFTGNFVTMRAAEGNYTQKFNIFQSAERPPKR